MQFSDLTSSDTLKFVTIEVNGKKMEELDDETINAMTVDDFLKFYDEDQIPSDNDDEENCNIDKLEDELPHNKNVESNSKYLKTKDVVLQKSTRRKSQRVNK